MTTREKPKLPAELTTIVADLVKAGAKPYLVGGAVRDWLMGRTAKDTDIEVYGISAEKLIEILQPYGRASQVGVSFGVIKLTTYKGNEYDFSLPRRESKSGEGHRGFIVKPDPTMTVKEACGRRDYTVNAMAYDLATDELHDYYNGQEHLKDKVLRHTTIHFAEDPLRVLRGFQMAARFDMTIHPDTATLCKLIKDKFKTLAKERIWGEWEKWGTKPYKDFDKGIEFLRATGWDEHFPGIATLKTYHLYKTGSFSGEMRLLMLLTALCDHLSIGDSERLLDSIGTLPAIKTKCLKILGADKLIRPTHFGPLKVTDKIVRRISVNLHPATVRELAWHMSVCGDDSYKPDEVLAKVAVTLGVMDGKPVPLVMGRHLVEKGLATPGPTMGKVLAKVYDAQLDGKVSDEMSALEMAKTLLAQGV